MGAWCCPFLPLPRAVQRLPGQYIVGAVVTISRATMGGSQKGDRTQHAAFVLYDSFQTWEYGAYQQTRAAADGLPSCLRCVQWRSINTTINEQALPFRTTIRAAKKHQMAERKTLLHFLRRTQYNFYSEILRGTDNR